MGKSQNKSPVISEGVKALGCLTIRTTERKFQIDVTVSVTNLAE